ncbi:hypothetical protein Syn6312_0955 [Synechococcus sp. PCC 6312]|nr:hypothetical protein Syn6312_0955 [Synechococcus sp. PCC 6312]
MHLTIESSFISVLGYLRQVMDTVRLTKPEEAYFSG